MTSFDGRVINDLLGVKVTQFRRNERINGKAYRVDMESISYVIFSH